MSSFGQTLAVRLPLPKDQKNMREVFSKLKSDGIKIHEL
jgi:hypothetical protein